MSLQNVREPWINDLNVLFDRHTYNDIKQISIEVLLMTRENLIPFVF